MAPGITKFHGKKQTADKFYTSKTIAQSCLALIEDLSTYDEYIEPSAGNGAFSSLIPNALAFDIEPEAAGIIEQDWFAYNRERDGRRILVFGNPPFGEQNSLSIKFINHAAEFADTIAFILPMSFKKASIQNKLHENLHLVKEYDVPKNSFVLDGLPYNVPCVFQIWKFDGANKRPRIEKVQPLNFTFVKREEAPDFSVQRIGGRTGSADRNYSEKNLQSHYFVKLNVTLDETEIDAIVAQVNAHDFPTRYYSVGPRSISKSDIAEVLNTFIF